MSAYTNPPDIFIVICMNGMSFGSEKLKLYTYLIKFQPSMANFRNTMNLQSFVIFILMSLMYTFFQHKNISNLARKEAPALSYIDENVDKHLKLTTRLHLYVIELFETWVRHNMCTMTTFWGKKVDGFLRLLFFFFASWIRLKTVPRLKLGREKKGSDI